MVDEIIDYVTNFDSKNITLSILFTNGRSGSVLFQTLLDNHPQTISTLIPFSFYHTWNLFATSSKDIEDLISELFKYMKKCASYESYICLGKDKNDSVMEILEETENILKTVIRKIPVIDRKSFFLALIFSLGSVLKYNLSDIKCIFHHEHYFNIDYLSGEIDDYFRNGYIELDSIYNDFKNAKIIITIRNPYQLYQSHLKFFKHKNFIHLPYFLSGVLKQILFNYYFISGILESKNYNIKIIKFEDIHLNNSYIISETCKFLNIDYFESLLESTIAGKIWWGSKPISNPVNGINPKLIENDLNDNSEKLSNQLSISIFKDVYTKYQYKQCIKEKEFNNKIFIEDEFESLIHVIFKEFLFLDQLKILNNLDKNNLEENIFFSEGYPFLRKKVLNYFLDENKDSYLDEIININGLDIFIKNIFRKNFIYPDKGYFIFFSCWNYCYLPIDSVYKINKLVDQVWVPNNFLKELYIDSGVIEEKIKVIPYGVDNNSLTTTYDFYSDSSIKELQLDYLINNTFNFVFIGRLDSNSGIDLLISTYNEVFYSNKNVSLTIIDIDKAFGTSNSEIRINTSTNSKKIDDFILNDRINLNLSLSSYSEKSPKLKIIEYSLFGYDLKLLFEKFDCAIYPFKYDNLCLKVPEIMISKTPLIITDSAVARDFCNNENSYLLKNELIDLGVDEIDGVKLAGNRFEFSPDIEHLKFLMKYAYDNPEETKSKGKKAKEYIENNFNWNNTFNLVYENIENLRDKPIFRYDFLNKKEELDSKIDDYIKHKNYESAELILLDLIPYDISYIHKLSDVLIKQCKYEEALDYLTQTLDYEGLSYSLCLMIAECLEQTGDYETAKDFYTKAKDF